MSKSKTVEQREQSVEIVVSPTALSAGQVKQINDRIERIDEMKPGISLQSSYRDFNMGDTVRGVFIGFKPFQMADKKTGEAKTLDAAHWIEKDGRLYMNSGANLISQLSKNDIGTGTPIQITLVGTDKAKKSGGTVNIFDVRILNDLSNIETE